jgi:L-alanine-DL-glutamate epimerase-like enolase superfamily enzyme
MVAHERDGKLRWLGALREGHMTGSSLYPLKLHVRLEEWPLRSPFRISNHLWTTLQVVVVDLEHCGAVGTAEAAGVYYRADRPEEIKRALERIWPEKEAEIDRKVLQQRLPPGGLRNALDCALWDLEAKLSGRRVWQLAGLNQPQRLLTTFTCGADSPPGMAAQARSYAEARAIKVKLTGELLDADRLVAIREARPDVWLSVDANQAFTPRSLERLMPLLLETRVSLIEQPFPVGKESWLDGLHSPISVAADESVQGLADMHQLIGRCSTINIKLDKCGGLTEALAMARTARELGFHVMVGNMLGTSLAMAPAFLLGQLCEVVDLDGPVFLQKDRLPSVNYTDGFISCPDSLWG